MIARHSKHITRGARWAALRLQVLRRDGFKCRACGARARLEIDHIKPVRTDPQLAWDASNLQPLCPGCHTRKTNLEQGRSAPNPDRLAWAALLREDVKC
ncbi:HNH endonuclease signature motif containing protein [Acuticoccus sp. MNP-M23]|uniref:HNH endonuclease n=1 Tax=Acuticoccus sp. MNP-M23 TaxID=3072793 RepID=UPI0028160830|nr:HNH endonuclease signature motif containing protein [Acuticoccus sp. MNP-M23]WMS43439.1 HNH endonuclease signature motif containing protein [Acuticoccus sp. MNP-M23]